MPPVVKGQLIGKDPDAGKDLRQEEKGATEDEMVGRHHQLTEFTQLMSIESVMLSNHLILCRPLLLLP